LDVPPLAHGFESGSCQFELKMQFLGFMYWPATPCTDRSQKIGSSPPPTSGDRPNTGVGTASGSMVK
jgi:hypothetical protein